MADQRITQLTELSEAGVAEDDVLAIVDIGGSETKKVTAKNLVAAGVALIDDDAIDLSKLDQSSTTKLGTTALADDAVTYAKIQDVSATDKLLGRSTAGSGDIEEIDCTAAGRALLDDADAAAQRTTLGLGTIATQNSTSATLSGVTITSGDITGITDLAIADGGTGASTEAAARTNLGVEIGTNVQAYDAGLASIAGLTTSADQSIYLTATDTYAAYTLTAFARSLLDDADAAAVRATLGLGTLATQDATVSGTFSGTSTGTNTGDQTITLTGPVTGTGTGTFATTISAGAIGTNELSSDAVTYDILQDTSSTDVILGRSTVGAGTVEEITCTSAGRALLDDADAAAQRATLGLGSIALGTGTWVNGSSFSGTSSGTNTGDQTITLTGAVTGSGTGSFATALANDIVLQANIAASAVTTAKINDSAVTAAKLGDESTAIVSNASPSGNGDFVGQGWFDTNSAIHYSWDGTTWTQEAGLTAITITESTPLSLAVSYPDAYTANLAITLDTQVANSVFAGPTTGADASPTFRTLVAADLPDATASTKGAIIPGTGLAVSGSTLNHSNTVTAGTTSGFTIDAQGHVTATAALVASDIPDLDAAKITTGTFGTTLIADAAITADKLGNKSTAQIGETLPVADFIGQMFFNPLDRNFFMWDGNVWQSIGISAGSIVLGGTYDASTNQLATVTSEGSAIGLSVGNSLPTASEANSNYYVVVSETGTGTAPAPTVALAPPDILLSTGSVWTEIDVSSIYTAQTASNVAFTPAANLSSTNVQAALEEVSNECRDVDNMTAGTLDVNRGGTNIASYTKGDLLAASGSTTLNKLAAGTNGYILSANSGETTGLEWIANTVGTVTSVTGTSPVQVATGTSTPVISVNAGTTSAAGILQLTDGVASSSTTTAATPNGVKTAYDLAALALPKAGGTVTGQILIDTTGSLVFEGSSPDAFETTLAVANPTADHTVTLPNSTGTVALTSQLDDGTFN